MSIDLLTAVALVASTLPSIAAAQQQPQQPQQHGADIVVQGNKNPQKKIQDFVKELTPAHIGSQLGRFLQPVCPRVLGLSDGENALVESRMRKVAASIGAPVAPQKCVVDVYVLIGGDKRETIQGIRKQFGDLVEGVPDSVLDRLETAPEPVASWQIVGRIGSDGMPLASVANSQGDAVPMASTIGWASRITNVTRPQFLGSVLVIEAKALNGVDTRQLADYAVMRTLAPTDSTHSVALPERSIIQLFDPGTSPETGPQSVTWWDYAYLKALYSTSNTVNAFQQRNEMASKMAEELAAVPSD